MLACLAGMAGFAGAAHFGIGSDEGSGERGDIAALLDGVVISTWGCDHSFTPEMLLRMLQE